VAAALLHAPRRGQERREHGQGTCRIRALRRGVGRSRRDQRHVRVQAARAATCEISRLLRGRRADRRRGWPGTGQVSHRKGPGSRSPTSRRSGLRRSTRFPTASGYIPVAHCPRSCGNAAPARPTVVCRERARARAVGAGRLPVRSCLALAPARSGAELAWTNADAARGRASAGA
jgi:hypothetical protein